jgi:hypothetical protein
MCGPAGHTIYEGIHQFMPHGRIPPVRRVCEGAG